MQITETVLNSFCVNYGFPGWLSGQELACQCRKLVFNP